MAGDEGRPCAIRFTGRVWEEMESLCEELVRSERLPSISLAVGRHHSVEYARAFGFADLAMGVPARVDTPYLLASVTKPVTATATTLLAQRGLLDLDDPIEDHLGGLRIPRGAPDITAAPTIRQALTHTAGFGTHWDFTYSDRPASRPSLAHTVARYATLFREPGTRFEYSNLGYGLLDHVIARVSGEPAGSFVAREVLAATGATSGWMGPVYRGRAEAAVRYSRELTPYPVYDTTHRGASMGWASARDIVRFGLSHTTDSGALDAAGRQVAHTPTEVVIGEPDKDGYALGWGVRNLGDYRVLSHGGDMGGVGAVLSVIPERRIAVAVLVNRTGSLDAALRVRDALLCHLMPQYRPPDSAANATSVPQSLRTGHWAGSITTYVGEVAVALDVDGAGSVVARVGDGPAVVASEPPSPDPAYPVRLRVPARLPTPDAMDTSLIELALNADGDRADGAARAMRDGEVAERVGNCRSHWISLRRT